MDSYNNENDTYNKNGIAIRVMKKLLYNDLTSKFGGTRICTEISSRKNSGRSCFYITSYSGIHECGNIIEYVVSGDSKRRKIEMKDKFNIDYIWAYGKGEQNFSLEPNQTNAKWSDLNIAYDTSFYEYKYETPAQIIYRRSTSNFNALNIPDSYLKYTRWYYSSDISSAKIIWRNENNMNSVPTFPDFKSDNEEYYYLKYGLLNIAEFAAINSGNEELKFYDSSTSNINRKGNYLTFNFNLSTASILQSKNYQCMADGVTADFYLSYTIDSNLLVCSGDGTKDKPYIIKDKC